jgi:aspartate dehydrogenase
MAKKRVGIVGYGDLGRYLVQSILHDERVSSQLELAFVWNRTSEKLHADDIPQALILNNLDDFRSQRVDLIVEVAHASVTEAYAAQFLEVADFMVGSPTVFASATIEAKVREASQKKNGFGLYIPAGALANRDVHHFNVV